MRKLYDYNVTDCYKHNTYFCVTKIKYIIDNVQVFFITTITVVKEPERMYVNKHCVFHCSKSKTIHGDTPV